MFHSVAQASLELYNLGGLLQSHYGHELPIQRNALKLKLYHTIIDHIPRVVEGPTYSLFNIVLGDPDMDCLTSQPHQHLLSLSDYIKPMNGLYSSILFLISRTCPFKQNSLGPISHRYSNVQDSGVTAPSYLVEGFCSILCCVLHFPNQSLTNMYRSSVLCQCSDGHMAPVLLIFVSHKSWLSSTLLWRN